MSRLSFAADNQLSELTILIARKLMISPDMILPYSDLDDFLLHLLAECKPQSDILITTGHISPDVALAADRAGLIVNERFGASPFTASAEAALDRVASGNELIYVANPNRITGSNLGLTDLELLSRVIPEGNLIVDEYYFDYFGISAIPLINSHSNVCVLRSFTSSYGINSAESGFMIASPNMINRIKNRLNLNSISNTVFRTAILCLQNDAVLAERLKTLHEEALRTSVQLSHLGLQNRITAADFLLMRVKDTTATGDFLTRCKVPIENLDGYPNLKNYLRYKLQSPLSNDALLDAVKKMPAEYYQTATPDLRIVKLLRPAEKSPVIMEHESPVIPEKVVSRTKRIKKAVAKSRVKSR